MLLLHLLNLLLHVLNDNLNLLDVFFHGVLLAQVLAALVRILSPEHVILQSIFDPRCLFLDHGELLKVRGHFWAIVAALRQIWIVDVAKNDALVFLFLVLLQHKWQFESVDAIFISFRR